MACVMPNSATYILWWSAATANQLLNMSTLTLQRNLSTDPQITAQDKQELLTSGFIFPTQACHRMQHCKWKGCHLPLPSLWPVPTDTNPTWARCTLATPLHTAIRCRLHRKNAHFCSACSNVRRTWAEILISRATRKCSAKFPRHAILRPRN